MSAAFPLVDAHVHVVAEDETRYPLNPAGLPGAWYREAPHSAEDFRACMQQAGVAQAVLVQPVGAYSFDNRYVADATGAHRDLFVGACCVDPHGEDPAAELRYWVQERGLHGVRLFALDASGPGWLAREEARALWECADDLAAHVIVTIFAHQLPELRAVLQRHPRVRVSLDHCGFPALEGPPWTAADSLVELAGHENLYLKITTHLLHGVQEKGHSPAAWVEHLVARFGAHRLMWGSDFSQTHSGTYPELVAFAREVFGGLSPADQALCLGGTAARLWPLPPSA